MAGAHAIVVTIVGKGGHAAMPHTTVDPVVAGAFVLVERRFYAPDVFISVRQPIHARKSCRQCCGKAASLQSASAAAAIVMALQSVVSRETDPLGSTVISITQATSSASHNSTSHVLRVA